MVIKKKYKLITIFFFIIFLLNFLSAITLQENTQFQPTSTNTTFIMGNNLSFDLIEVHPTYLKLDNNTIFVNSSVGSVNVTIFNFTDSYKKWTETATDSLATVRHTVGNFTVGASMLVKKNSVVWSGLTSNSTGYISFTYSGSYPITFEVEAGTMPTTTEEEEETPSGGGYPTYKPNQSQLEEGYEKSLRENWKIEFEFENETRTIKLDKIVNKTATLTVSSVPITFELIVNETKKLNLNDDGFYDLQIFLKNITDYKADLIVKIIHEEIPAEELEGVEKKGKIKDLINNFIEFIKLYWLWILIGGFIIIVFGIIVVLRIVKKNKKKYLGAHGSKKIRKEKLKVRSF